MATSTHYEPRPPDHFELVLRLQQSRNGNPFEVENGHSLAHALVKDVLKSRLDVDADTGMENFVHAQGFTDLGRALAASRALQLAFEGFRKAVPATRANISVVLDSPPCDEAQFGFGSPSVEQKDLLGLAKPSQVLITQALFDKIAQYQPIALRSFPSRAGVYEFLWTGAERLEELRIEGEVIPKRVTEPVASIAEDKTVISYRSPRTQFPPAPEPPPQDSFRVPTQHPVVPVFEELEPRRSALSKLGISAAVAILMGACALAGWHFYAGNPSTPQTSPATSVATQSQPQPQGPVIVDPPPKPPEPPKQVVVVPPTEPKPTPKPHARSCDLVSSEYATYNNMARKHRNDGNIAAARDDYFQVLACDPGNAEAKAGLQRLQ